MFSVFLDLIKGVGIFLIISRTLLHFGIGKKYETYMKLVISLMVAAQIIFAFGTFFNADSGKNLMMSEAEYYKKWEENMNRLEKAFEEEQKKREEQLQEQVTKETQSQEEANSGNRIYVEKIRIQ